ncbi:hypothetical protein IWW37_002570 [Coemansia sp. RSA 2050]|nr:hypothetical protein IWW37_002570 [Coemansia sp. RSA 2050]
MQLAQYQYSPRNLATNERPRAAVADYFDPYRSPAPGQQTLLAVDAAPRPTAPPAPAALQAPSSPVMRATRHSRPTTPTTTQVVHAQYSNPPSAQSSRDSLRSPPHTPIAQQMPQRHGMQPQAGKPLARAAELLTMPEFGFSTDLAFGVRMKPRAYAGSDEVPAPARPRVSSMYATSGFVPSSSSPLQADSSRLARPIARPRQPQQGSPTPPPVASMERSELIDFIERRRAQTFASTPAEPPPPAAPAIMYGKPRASTALVSETVGAPRMERSESVSSRRSDSSERSFKRSTARLADVTATTALSKQPSADRVLPPPRPAPTQWLGTSDVAIGSTNALSSNRVVPRTHTVAPEAPSDNHTLAATRSNEALPPPRVFARSKRPESAHLERTPAIFTRGDLARAPPRVLSTSVQTDESLSAASGFKPLMFDTLRKKPSAVDRAIQTTVTAADSIHNDEAVLDLMRQMDSLRMTHANQITEYQEQVLDLELLNQDLHNDVELLNMRLEAMEAAHKRAMDDMRQRLGATRLRVDREISDVKGMHATKCNELSDQVCMLLDRCEKYKARLAIHGDTEDQLLQLVADAKGLATKQEPVQKGGAIEQVQIIDQAFIERQYIETRESSQEVDYFKQLMDIERSMENTTIALGFELKRTQAKYLQQAADFIREQMARFQTDARAESRLSARSESRLSAVVSPAKPAEPPQLPPLPMSREPLVLPPVPPSVQPSSTVSYPSSSLAQALQAQHRRVAGAEPLQSRFATPDAESVDVPIEVSIGELRNETKIVTGDRQFSGTMPLSQQRSFADSLQQQRSATVSAHSHTRGLGVNLGSDTRSLGLGSQASGLSRMVGGSPPVASISAGSDISELSMADLLLLSNGSPRRSHRSPLAAIASGFFSSSQKSMATTIAHSDTTDPHQLMHSSLATLVTPTKPMEAGAQPIAVSNSMGYFSGHSHKTRGDSLRDTPPSKPSTIHWPPRSERRPSPSRPSSMAIDTQDMTAEQLLESLKLPPVASISTPTRPSVTPCGSLGRNSSPRARAGSYSDLSRACPPPRFSVMSESPSSDSTILHASNASIASVGSIGSTSSLGSLGKPYVYQSHKAPMSLGRGSKK